MAICAGILCAPLGWYYYVLLAAPVFTSRRWGRSETFAACLLFIPSIFSLTAMGHGRFLLFLSAMPYFTGVCLMLISFMRVAVDDSDPGISAASTGCPPVSLLRSMS